MKTADLRNKSVAELEKDLIALREEQFKNQMKRATGQLEKSHVIQQVRRNVARLKTILNEKRNVRSK
jgi:large subunit ribosomal protein L29